MKMYELLRNKEQATDFSFLKQDTNEHDVKDMYV